MNNTDKVFIRFICVPDDLISGMSIEVFGPFENEDEAATVADNLNAKDWDGCRVDATPINIEVREYAYDILA